MCKAKEYIEGTKIINIIGQKFHFLEVVGLDEERKTNDLERVSRNEIKKIENHWICKCECGNVVSVSSGALKTGNTKSCGCYNATVSSKNGSRIKSISFFEWCRMNNKSKYLDLWDYELNDVSPKEIGYSSSKYIYFRCENNKHESSETSLRIITQKKNTNEHMKLCKACNSIGQHIIDTCGDLKFYWSDENKLNPMCTNIGAKEKIIIKCDVCKKEKKISCYDFYKNGLRCSCGDGISYSEKFLINVLQQLKVEFIKEYSTEWIKPRRYDFYIQSVDCIIENHGLQHYVGWGYNKNDSLLQKSNDKTKQDLALQNGIKHYIVLDCRKSDIDWIKNSIMNSKLPKLLNFKEEDIDWEECQLYAVKNLVKEVCDMWEKSKTTIRYISKEFGLSVWTIREYLKKGNIVGICTYDANDEIIKSSSMSGKLSGKKVEVFKDGESKGVFDSCAEIQRVSYELFGVQIYTSEVSRACNGKINECKGYSFKYITQ